MFGIDAIVAVGGMILPPIFDFIKKKFLGPSSDTPEATAASLAVTKPEAVEGYVGGMAALWKAQAEFFNRDVSGTPSQWVVDLRAVIRPGATVVAFLILVGMTVAAVSGVSIEPTMQTTLDGVRYNCELIVSSWFGSRISLTASK
jgi:hypothetical protein